MQGVHKVSPDPWQRELFCEQKVVAKRWAAKRGARVEGYDYPAWPNPHEFPLSGIIVTRERSSRAARVWHERH